MMMNYFYQIKKSEITHNVPQEKIVSLSVVNPTYKTRDNYVIRYTRAFITKEQLENLKDYVMWSTETTSTEFGILFISNEDKVIATKLTIDPHFSDLIALMPVEPLKPETTKLSTWPERKVKVFNTKEEWLNDREKKAQKKQEKNTEYFETAEKINKTNPEISFKTPKFRVVEVLKPTKKIEAKVGDIIYGELPILKKADNGSIQGCLFGGNSYTNYIHCYVNDKKVKELSPLHFQMVFQENYIVELV